MCVVQEEPVVDELSAVSNHNGRTLAEGHYTADCKLPDGSWHRFADQEVHPVKESDIVTADAYLLFYSQQDQADSK